MAISHTIKSRGPTQSKAIKSWSCVPTNTSEHSRCLWRMPSVTTSSDEHDATMETMDAKPSTPSGIGLPRHARLPRNGKSACPNARNGFGSTTRPAHATATTSAYHAESVNDAGNASFAFLHCCAKH